MSRRLVHGLVAALLVLGAVTAGAQATGTLSGRVLDPNGNRLPGARIVVEGTNLTSQTSTDGSYRIGPLPAGAQRVTVSFVGFETQTFEVEVPADGEVITRDFTLDQSVFTDVVNVRAEPILQGQARALNQQKTAINIINVVAADQIGRFPDPNAAEATQRVPGVTLLRDQGEGRFIVIRGTEPGFNTSMINGTRIPAPEGGGREVALDVVPADLLEAIEVTKAVTPDMDADAIGGVVNLVTKIAPDQQRFSAAAGWGYNDIVDDDMLLANATWGGRLGANRDLGAVISGSALDTDRGSDNFEPAYDDGELDELEIRDYEVNRERYGVTGALDYRLADASQLRFTGIYNEFADQEYRRAFNNAVSDNELARELKDRYEVQEIMQFGLSGDSLVASKNLFEYRVTWAKALEDEPDSYYSTFLQEDVEFAPNVSPGFIDPDNVQANPLNEDFAEYFLDEISNESVLTEEEELSARLDYSLPFFRDADFSGQWQFGVQGRFQEKDRNNEVFLFEEDDVPFLDYVSGWTEQRAHFGGRYTVPPFQRISASREIIDRFDLEGERDIEEDLADYDASEDILAAYGMGELQFGERLTLLAGLRWEDTDIDYGAFELIFDEEGDPVSLTPVRGSNSYDELLPNVHLVYRLDEKTNLRGAVTRTYARPAFEDLAPFDLILEEDREIERGNPDLDPTKSWNLDVLLERYLSTVGILAAGLFYKDLEDNIYLFNFEEERNGDVFDVFQPLNGQGGEVFGAEVAYQNRFLNLPGALSGLGLFFNYTWSDSEARYPERSATQLPGQAESVGNLAVSYERWGFSGRLALNYQDKLILSPGDAPDEDEWLDERVQLDFSARQRFAPRWSVALDLINLTDEPYRVFVGTSDRPIQEEIYSWWGSLSLKYDM